jgi:hypothetical protein
MFTYVFYIGGMVIVGAVICSVLFMGYKDAPSWVRGRAGMTALIVLCVASMLVFPYAGWSHASRSKDITRRNNEFAALEAEITKMDFDGQCEFNGYKTSPRTSSNNVFPCIQRGDIRIVSNPFRAGLSYFVIDKNGIPDRWKSMVDYPIPFSFPNDRKLLDLEKVRTTFMTGEGEPSPAPVTAGE